MPDTIPPSPILTGTLMLRRLARELRQVIGTASNTGHNYDLSVAARALDEMASTPVHVSPAAAFVADYSIASAAGMTTATLDDEVARP